MPNHFVNDIVGVIEETRIPVTLQYIEQRMGEHGGFRLFAGRSQHNKAIARALNISALTVKKHTIHLYQKLGVHSRQQAVARARALGILPLDDA